MFIIILNFFFRVGVLFLFTFVFCFGRYLFLENELRCSGRFVRVSFDFKNSFFRSRFGEESCLIVVFRREILELFDVLGA